MVLVSPSLVNLNIYRISSIRRCSYYLFRCSFRVATIRGQQHLFLCVCVPHLLAAATIRGRRSFRSKAYRIVRLLFEGSDYLRAVSIRGQRLLEEIRYYISLSPTSCNPPPIAGPIAYPMDSASSIIPFTCRKKKVFISKLLKCPESAVHGGLLVSQALGLVGKKMKFNMN